MDRLKINSRVHAGPCTVMKSESGMKIKMKDMIVT